MSWSNIFISKDDYYGLISIIFPNYISNKQDYNTYRDIEEIWWKDYFGKIFLKHFDPQKNITLVFWESCGKVLKNYAFRNLDNNLINNSYLKAVCKKANIFHDISTSNNPDILNQNSKKKEALELLSKNNWLIIDLYPTHGIELKSKKEDYLSRDKLVHIFFGYTIPKLKKINDLVLILTGLKFNKTIYHLPSLNNRKLEGAKFPYKDENKLKRTLTIYSKQISSALRIKDISFKPYEYM